jgi:tetratricopeptide (TPR) repeat protein
MRERAQAMTSHTAKKRIVLIAAGACLVGSVFIYVGYWRSSPAPPAVAREGIEPAVWAAIEEAREAIKESPRSAEAWGRLGMVLFAHRFVAEAVGCLGEARKRDVRDPRWPYYLGMALSLTDPDGAIPHWQAAAERSREDAPQLRLAEALEAAGRQEDARAQWEQLLAQRSDHPMAHLGLARASLALGQDQDCLGHLTYAVASPLTRKAAYAVQASVHERLGDHQAAEEDARNAARAPADRSWPNPFTAELARLRVDRRSRLTQATERIEHGRPREGLALLNKLVHDEPEFEQAWLALGYACLQLGDYERAEQALDVALRLAPDAADGHYYRGCVAYNQGKIATAEACFRRAVEHKPDYALALYQLGMCRERQEDPAGASAAYQAAITARPNLAEAHREWARLLIRQGRRHEADQQLHLALELKPDDPAVLQMLGNLKK